MSISPFIYYGNFELKENQNYDIIGEIKENSDSYDIKQVTKYLQLIYALEKNDSLNERMCFVKRTLKF